MVLMLIKAMVAAGGEHNDILELLIHHSCGVNHSRMGTGRKILRQRLLPTIRLSKIMPRNFASSTTGIGLPLRES